jgi:putative phosphoribosyl transferase
MTTKTQPVIRQVLIGGADIALPGTLVLPSGCRAIVIFAHGSGSSRHSPRNQLVAGVLQDAGIGTLLFDLLTEIEARDRRNVFDIELLARRLDLARRWVEADAPVANPVLGYFGASTGAAAALVAAAEHPSSVAAVVSRGGRPDLAGAALPRVTAPTLLIVGSEDYDVLELNRDALRRLTGVRDKKLAVVPGATHLFEESGTLEKAAALAMEWFAMYLQRQPAAAAAPAP